MKVNTTDRGLLLDMAPAADDAQKNMHTSYVVVNHENYFNTKVINITKLLDSFLFKLTTKSTACRLSGDATACLILVGYPQPVRQ
jgi:hypothetical protein